MDTNIKHVGAFISVYDSPGMNAAIYPTIFTSFFTRYENLKQLACFCGAAPFEYTYGTSPQKWAKTHHMENRVLKRQFHMCALSAINHDPELREYYQRKAAEGKNKMLEINNVRNKLILRNCTVMKRQKP